MVESYGTWLLLQRLDDSSKDSDIPKNVPFAFAINNRNIVQGTRRRRRAPRTLSRRDRVGLPRLHVPNAPSLRSGTEMSERHDDVNDGHGSRGGVSDGVERQGYRHGPDRTVTMYELAGGVNARFGKKRGVGEGTPTGPRMLTVSYLRWST